MSIRMRFRACCVALAVFMGLPCAGVCSAVEAAPVNVKDFVRSAPFTSPVLSPDGQYLAVTVHNDKWNLPDYQLVVFHLPDLKGVSKLNMKGGSQPLNVVWASNTRLAFELARTPMWEERPARTGQVVAIDYDGKNESTLWSPVGHWADQIHGTASIAGVPYPRNGHVYMAISWWPAQRGASSLDAYASQLVDVDASSGLRATLAYVDRGNLSFVIHDGTVRYAYNGSNAVAVRSDSNSSWRALRKENRGKKMIPLRMSRDGSRLWSLFSAEGEPESLIESRPDGSERKVLASDPLDSVGQVLWNDRTGTPYAAVFEGERPHLAYLDQSLPAQALKALNDKFPDHEVTILGMDASSKVMLVLADSDRDPGSVALFDTRTMNLQPVYQVMGWIDPAQMAERKPFLFKASDGLQLEGYITLPNGRQSRRLATVLLPHGGPIGIRDHWTFDSEAEFLAKLGYAVIQVNYRGSGGRGPAFEASAYRHFGDRVQLDLLEGLHWAIDQGYVDSQRVCVYGASFGGYSALMQPIVAQHTYKCAIDYAGISDYTIEFDSSDTSKRASGRDYFFKAVGDRAQAKAISPLYQLDKFNVPVLIAHGKDDPRVPYKNAKVLRAALSKAGKPYQWLSKSEEQHGFYSESDSADMDRHVQKFLARYLGP